MKKVLFLLVLIILITGCSANVTYEFNDEGIDSTIEFLFNQEEFKKYVNENSVHEEGRFNTSSETEQFIRDKYQEITLIAYEENDQFKYYNQKNLEKENNKYKYTYNYSFSYDNFEKNYYLKDCFDHFIVVEDDDYYHYSIKGIYSCDNEKYLKLNIIAKDKDILSNADTKKDDQHIWNIKKENNDISFSISKGQKEKNTVINSFHIIGFILITILGIFGFVLYKLINKSK